MTEAQVNQLRQCADAVKRLAQTIALTGESASLDGRDTGTKQSRARVAASAARILSDAIGLTTGGQGSSRGTPQDPTADVSSEVSIEDPDAFVWTLALDLTTLRAQSDELAPIDEAVAALQLLSSVLASSATTMPSRVERLREIRRTAVRSIRPQPNGPYILTNVATVTDWLGQALIVPPTVAFCRCGGSRIKPFCDGSHVANGFDERKDPTRVGDRQDAYVGQQVTVLDNRGTCAHSGSCTDRLPTVFHQGQEPFVTPSGGRFDDIVRAVRACPSGALSFGVDGREAREQVDAVRPPAIEVSRDGPYRVTGGIPLVDASGTVVPRNAGASLEHYSLCRCGHSQNKPFCSGMHWSVRFTDPVIDADHQWTLFEWAGGLPALTRMTRFFYTKYVPEDPLIGPLFANMAPDHPERVAAWLGEVFGGPKHYSEQFGGYPRMLSQHMGKAITEAQRERWVTLLRRSADDAGLPRDPEWRAAFVAYLEWGSRLALENSQQDARPPAAMPMPRWWWVCNATPGSRVSALAPPTDDLSVSVPAPTEQMTFEAHIRPLFRRSDRQSMLFAFDLWAHVDVARHASEILRRLDNGSMPCDGPWPKQRVDVFRRWIESGMPA
jgi:CDGSH-type Zn-finger protein/truncated hemoglobin YjbI